MKTHTTETALNAATEIPVTSAANGRWTQHSVHVIGGQTVVAWYSLEWDEPAWDNFLETTPLGQHQQSSRWARAKKIEGWQPFRVILTLEGQIAGGFQILAKNTRFGRIGYISKGPVVIREEETMINFILPMAVSIAKSRRLAALILQPPDRSVMTDEMLARHRFSPNHIVNVISATLLVDISPDWQEIERRMRKTTCKQVRQAKRRGVVVREGGRQDIGKLFQLMTTTCQRQRTEPSPATETALAEIWQAFNTGEHAKLFLAEHDANPIAGLLCLCFGQTVVAWKKGWSGDHAERHPNTLLTFEAIKWAHDHGYHFVDFCAYRRDLAQARSTDDSLPANQEQALYWFNLGFGSKPVILPESKIYLANPMLRFAYRCLTASAVARACLRRLVATRI